MSTPTASLRGRSSSTEPQNPAKSTSSASRSASKSRAPTSSASPAGEWGSKSAKRTGRSPSTTQTAGGKPRGKVRRDLQSRVIVATARGDYVDLTPEPLSLESEQQKPQQQSASLPQGTVAANANANPATASTLTAHTQSSSMRPGRAGDAATMSGTTLGATTHTASITVSANHNNANNTNNNNNNNASVLAAVAAPALRELAQRAAPPSASDTAARVHDYFHASSAPSVSLAALAGLHKPRPPPRVWDERSLLQPVSVVLSETPTFTLLHIPARKAWGGTVTSTAAAPGLSLPTPALGGALTDGESSENWLAHAHTDVAPVGGVPSVPAPTPAVRGGSKKEKEAVAVRAANAAYTALLAHKDRDKFVSRGVETPSFSQRMRGTQTAPVRTREAGVEASAAAISDAYAETERDTASRVRRVAASLSAAAEHAASAAAAASVGVTAAATAAGAGGGNSTTTSSATTPAASALSSLSALSLADSTLSSASHWPAHPATNTNASGASILSVSPTPTLPPSLRALAARAEAVAAQNVWAAQQLLFHARVPTDASDLLPGDVQQPQTTTALPGAVVAPVLTRLWHFWSPLVAGRAVACIAACPALPSLIAVGYGCKQDPPEHSPNGACGCACGCGRKEPLDGTVCARAVGGMLCLWSPATPHHPILVRHTRAAVTSIAFSPRHPAVLAVGLAGGEVQLHDLAHSPATARALSGGRTAEADAPSTSCECGGRVRVWEGGLRASAGEAHNDTVWSLAWVQEQREPRLLSASGDGSVRAWAVRQSLQSRVVVRVPRDHGGDKGAGSAANSTPAPRVGPNGALRGNRYGLNPSAPSADVCVSASALSLAAPADEPRTYLVGSSDGRVHRCSLSFDARPLSQWPLHAGAVTRVTCSPFIQALFLSAAADGTVALCHARRAAPLVGTVCRVGGGAADAAWCPGNAGAFAVVSGAGAVQVWDLAVSASEPLCTGVVASAAAQERAGASVGSTSAVGATCVTWRADTPVLLVGQSDGGVAAVHVGKLRWSTCECGARSGEHVGERIGDRASMRREKGEEGRERGKERELEREDADECVCVRSSECEQLRQALITHCDYDCAEPHEDGE